MACLHMKKKLSEYLDGVLDAEEISLVEEHLATCKDCSVTLSELKTTVEHMNALDEVEPPAWFTENVMQRVRKESARKSFLRKLFFPLHIKVPVEAFALVLVAVVAVYVFDAMSPEVAMKEPVAPAPPIVAEMPEADAVPPDAFEHSRDEALKPFAPIPAEPAPEEEGAWEQEDLEAGAETEVRKYAANETAKFRSEPAPSGEVLMKSEPQMDEFRAKKDEGLLRDARIGEERVAGPSKGRQDIGGAVMELKAAPQGAGLNIEMSVEDIDFARHEIEGAIKRLGGKIIDDEELPDHILLAEVEDKVLPDLAEAIAKVGEIKRGDLKATGDKILLRIELFENASP